MTTVGKGLVRLVLATLLMVAVVTAPRAVASPQMSVGNYALLSDRWTDHSWVWAVNYQCKGGDPKCGTLLTDPVLAPESSERNVIAIPRPQRSQRFQNTAFYADDRYTLTVDVIDGVRCFGYNLPSHDVYSWNAGSLDGTIVSTFDAGCSGAPSGTSTWTFALQRL